MNKKPEQLPAGSKEKKSKERLKQTLRRYSFAAILSAIALLPNLKAHGEKNEVSMIKIPGKEETVKRVKNIPLAIQRLDEKIDKNLKWPDFDLTFFKLNKDGKLGFNWTSLIAPLNINIAWEKEGEDTETADIAYHWSRDFNSAQASNEDDKQKLLDIMNEEFSQQFLDGLMGLDTSKDVFRYAHPEWQDEQSVRQITSLRIVGTTSPEGPEAKGPVTVKPGAEDAENQALGTRRAKDVAQIFPEFLKQHGIDEKILAETFKDIGSQEIQFTNQEMEELTQVANELGMPGSDNLERIFNLIKEYNEEKIEDNKILQKLDQIIASKRGAIIKMETQSKVKHYLIIPIPLLLLLLFKRPPWIARKKKEQGQKEQLQGEEKLPQPPSEIDKEKYRLGDGEEIELSSYPKPSLPIEKYKYYQKQLETLPKINRKNRQEINDQRKKIEGILPTIQAEMREILGKSQPVFDKIDMPKTNSNEYKAMEEEVMLQDISRFWDDKNAIRRGIDYPEMATGIDRVKTIFKTESEQEQYLAMMILAAWEKHDKVARIEAGWHAADLGQGLDYHHQPRQIQFALMHAKKIIELNQAKKETPKTSYLELIDDETEKIKLRKFLDQRS
jgi:hypothetical protein